MYNKINLFSRTVILWLLILFVSACQPDAVQPESETQAESTIGMLQHTVFFYLNDDVTQEEREQFEAGLKLLLEIPEIYRSETGIPAETAVRDVTDHSYGYAIYTWFKTMEDYKGYDEHPDHIEFIETYSHLWADVKVYDAAIYDAR